MSGIAVRWREALDAFTSGTDRLVHPHVPNGPVRRRQVRLIGAILCGISLFALSLCVVLPAKTVATLDMLLLGAAGVLAVLALLAVAARGPERAGGWLALLAATVAIASVCRLSGGLASPLALGLVALPLEAWNVRRERSAFLAGLGAAALAGVGVAFAGMPAGSDPLVHAAYWLPVLAWGATLWGRAMHAAEEASETAPAALPLDPGAVMLQFEPSGEIADASPETQSALGLAPELLLGLGLFERLHVADRVTFLCAVGDMKHGADRRQVELRVRLPRAGASGPHEFRPFRLDLMRTGEAPTPFAAVMRDNCEVQDLRDRLAAAGQALEAAAREKTELLAVLGHEMRTPLNAILGFSGMLGSDALGGFRNPRQKEYAGLIQNCGEHLLAVLESMLDIGRLRAGARAVEPEAFALGAAAETCRAMVAMQAEAKGVSLHLDGTLPGATVCADRRIVSQILLNLVSNAVKFTPAGGRVAIGARAGGGKLVLRVSDTGIGIGCEELGRLGTPWTRFHADGAGSAEGCGLGLSLVKELAALHGGSVAVESVKGQGTTVQVVLPDAASRTPGRELVPAVSFTGERTGHDGFRRTA